MENGNKKILIYDDNEIHYIEADIIEFNIEQNYISYNDYSKPSKKSIPTDRTYTFTTVNNFDTDTIKLDETLMKRIAKYNKEIGVQKLEEKIKEKQKEIKELDDILQDRTQRVKKLKEFVAKIYDIDLNEDDNDDYDYDFWEE